MESSSGISSNSNSSGLPNSASDEDLQVMDLRKRKRMISNRESARRSRLRKQKHLEELMAQVAQLRRQNHQIVTSLRATTQHHAAVESENSILRAQAAELSHRLHWLVEIVSVMSSGDNGGGFPPNETYEGGTGAGLEAGLVGGLWNCLSQPIVMMPADTGLLY